MGHSGQTFQPWSRGLGQLRLPDRVQDGPELERAELGVATLFTEPILFFFPVQLTNTNRLFWLSSQRGEGGEGLRLRNGTIDQNSFQTIELQKSRGHREVAVLLSQPESWVAPGRPRGDPWKSSCHRCRWRRGKARERNAQGAFGMRASVSGPGGAVQRER